MARNSALCRVILVSRRDVNADTVAGGYSSHLTRAVVRLTGPPITRTDRTAAELTDGTASCQSWPWRQTDWAEPPVGVVMKARESRRAVTPAEEGQSVVTLAQGVHAG